MRLFTIRHGETDYNKKGRIMGSRIDAPLNDEGKEQARHVWDEAKEHNFEIMYCSPLLRAKETADIVNEKLGLEIIYRDDLKERDAGELTGKTGAELEDIAGIKSGSTTYNYRPYGGESVEDVEARVQGFLDFLEKEHGPHDDTGTEIVVVTHAEIIRLMYKLLSKEPAQSIHNVCVHEFQ